MVESPAMRETHPVFDAEIPPDTLIWRYFDLPKFVSMLQGSSLYFSRANLLGDPLEGSFPLGREAERQALLANPPENMTRDELKTVFAHNAQVYAQHLYCAYVNCWHIGAHESMAMWQGYGRGPYGLAIRSTYQRLDGVLPETFDSAIPMGNIFVGRVRYADYTSNTARLIEEHNAYAPFVSKSLPYQHESELRAVFLDMGYHGQRHSPAGYSVEVDLARLIECVTVSPLSPGWYQQVVEKLCTSAGLNIDVSRSIVFTDPIF